MPSLHPTVVTTPAEFLEALELRYTVFCDEQGISREVERDAEDAVATHVIMRNGSGRVVATGRALRQLGDERLVGLRAEGESTTVRIGRMAVLKESRRFGLGAQVLSLLEQEARAAGLRRVMLHAQTSAAPFYASCGYREHGEQFMEENIPHIEMIKDL